MAAKCPRPNRRVTGAWGMEVRGQIAVWLLSMTLVVAVVTAVMGPVTVRPGMVAVMSISHAVFGFAVWVAKSRLTAAFWGAGVLGLAAVLLFLFTGLDGHAFSPAAVYASVIVAAALVVATTVHERRFWRRIRIGLGREA